MEQGHAVNRKRVQRLMRVLGLAGMAPGPNTSRPHPEHKIYPYRLRGVAVVRPNQVWSTDITYIRLAHGFAYRVAIIDGYSRRVLAWRISNTLEAGFCVDCLEDALRTHGRPEVFNSDQGRSSPAMPSPRSCWTKASPSAWTDAAVLWTTSSSSGCGAASSTRTSTSRATRPTRAAARADRVLRVLQRRAAAPVPGQPYPGCRVPRGGRRRGQHRGPLRRHAGTHGDGIWWRRGGACRRFGGLRAVPADSVWTKRECRERTYGQGDHAPGARSLACPHSFTLCPHCAAPAPVRAEDACGATTGFLS
jgi:hypothetical protein